MLELPDSGWLVFSGVKTTSSLFQPLVRMAGSYKNLHWIRALRQMKPKWSTCQTQSVPDFQDKICTIWHLTRMIRISVLALVRVSTLIVDQNFKSCLRITENDTTFQILQAFDCTLSLLNFMNWWTPYLICSVANSAGQNGGRTKARLRWRRQKLCSMHVFAVHDEGGFLNFYDSSLIKIYVMVVISPYGRPIRIWRIPSNYDGKYDEKSMQLSSDAWWLTRDHQVEQIGSMSSRLLWN